jgi:hypothetical protein
MIADRWRIQEAQAHDPKSPIRPDSTPSEICNVKSAIHRRLARPARRTFHPRPD